MLTTHQKLSQLRAELHSRSGSAIDLSTGNPLGPAYLDTHVDPNVQSVYRTGRSLGQPRSAKLELFREYGLAANEGLGSIDNVILGLGATHLFGLVLKDISEQTKGCSKERVVIVSGPTYGIFADLLNDFGLSEVVASLFAEHHWKMQPVIRYLKGRVYKRPS
jgi:hypothetical protein